MQFSDRPIVLFDGICNFCNASVNFTMDRNETLMFTPLQGETGRRILISFGRDPEKMESMVLLQDGKLYDQSTAVLKIAGMLRFPWNLFSALLIIPAFIRNPVYQFIGKRRYKWFGRQSECRIPSPEERARFLG